ncbi:MAG TPA: hypothetical protein VF518_06370, partial [Polyangia bacterium]
MTLPVRAFSPTGADSDPLATGALGETGAATGTGCGADAGGESGWAARSALVARPGSIATERPWPGVFAGEPDRRWADEDTTSIEPVTRAVPGGE